jgi:Mn-containing catalase
MCHHVKKLICTVRIDQLDLSFRNMPLEQLGGANDELAIAMRHSIYLP